MPPAPAFSFLCAECMMSGEILAAPTAFLERELRLPYFGAVAVNDVEGFPWWSHGWLPRERLEKDESWLQLIPYIVVTARGTDGSKYALSYRRAKGSGEKRLLGKRSIGFGGHIELALDGQMPENNHGRRQHESDAEWAYRLGLLREFREELRLEGDRIMDVPVKFYIMDQTNAVGRVHLGFVHEYALETPLVFSHDPLLRVGALNGHDPEALLNSKSEDQPVWVSLMETPRAARDVEMPHPILNMENWSQIAWHALKEA
jgi:predicted NUDIX family phosphoesterase